MCKEVFLLETMIARTPARTLTGIREQVRLALDGCSKRLPAPAMETMALRQAEVGLTRLLDGR
jgi:hypothetical protein